MDLLIFDSREIEVVGVDENGYGPLVGPLIVTGVKVGFLGNDPILASEAQGYKFPIPVRDSKDLFKRDINSYRIGESVALTLLRASGIEVSTLQELIYNIVLEPFKLSEYGLEDLSLPAFGGFPNDRLLTYFKTCSITMKSILQRVIMADEFNELIRKVDNKAFLDFSLFLSIAERMGNGVYLMGKIGSTTKYGRFFEQLGIGYKALKETFAFSSYEIEGKKNMHFILNGDKKFLPIMFAGIIGKYIRELIMQALSLSLGYTDTIPFASGYFHDKKTFEILERLDSNLVPKWKRVR